MEQWITDTPNDAHIYADDLTIKTKDAQEIYPKLVTFEQCSKQYTIAINWGKILIIINESEYTIRALRQKLPTKYQKIRFATSGTLLGQKINLQEKTNGAVYARINKAKGAWGIIKYRSFLDKQIKAKNKFDLWHAAIGSILKYGLTTLRINETADRKIQQFTSKCTNEIIYQKANSINQEYEKRDTSEENRTKYCQPTVHSQLHKEKICDTYRWRTTLSPSYLNNQQEMEN